MFLAPRGEGFRDQGTNARRIGKRAAEITAQFALELRELRFVALDLIADSWLLSLLHQAVIFAQFRGPVGFLVHHKSEHFFAVGVPRAVTLQPGDALVIRIRWIVRRPSVAMRHQRHHNLRFIYLLHARGERRQAPAGRKVFHPSRREAAGLRRPCRA